MVRAGLEKKDPRLGTFIVLEMQTTNATAQHFARPSKIPIRAVSQAASASQYFGLEATPKPFQNQHATRLYQDRSVARPRRDRSASRSFERSLGHQWFRNPNHSLSLRTASLQEIEDEEEKGNAPGMEETVGKPHDETVPDDLPFFPTALAGCSKEHAFSDIDHPAIEGPFKWDAPSTRFDWHDRSAIPLLHAEIISALETLEDRLEYWYRLGLQGYSEELYVAPGQGRLIDISGLSQKILADCSLPVPVSTDLADLKSSSLSVDSRMLPQMLDIHNELNEEALVRLLGMLQHVVTVTAPEDGDSHSSVLQWKLHVRGTFDFPLDLRALGSTLRLVLCVSRQQRKQILAFFGNPFT